MDISNPGSIGKTIIYSIAHTAVAATAGTVLDSFFKFDPKEDTLATMGWLGLQTVLKGLTISGLFTMGMSGAGDEYDDPTGGSFVALTTFYVSKNYQQRLDRVASSMKSKIDSVLLPVNPVPVQEQ
jgi:hypothetical protein